MAEAQTQRSPVFSRIVDVLRAPEFGLVVGIVVVLALIYGLDSNGAFFSEYSRKTLLHQVALYGVLASGVAIVIIAGGIDLSIGSVVALSSVVSAKLLTSWLRAESEAATPPGSSIIALAIGLTLLMGMVIGLLHALMINEFRLPPFIATLATMAGLRSLAAIICKNKSINVSYEGFRMLGSNPWITLAIFAVVAACLSVMLGTTVLGRHLFAMGGNETAARLCGLPTKRLKLIAYGISGMLASVGGILFTGRSGQADARLGVSYELTAITAAVVGGCSLSGGVGSIRGTVLGILLIEIVIKATGQLAPQGIDSTQVEGLVLGSVVVLAVGFNQRIRGRG